MTLDDLMTLFQSARQGTRDWNGTEWVGVYGGDRAGVTAIVRALRDEFVTVFRREYLDDASIETFLSAQVVGMLDEILGSDAGEKVGTHGSPELDEDARKLEAMGQDPGMTLEELLAPATDAAPAVCVWTPRSNEPGFCGTPHGIKFKDRRYDHCGICGGEIKFTEAQ